MVICLDEWLAYLSIRCSLIEESCRAAELFFQLFLKKKQNGSLCVDCQLFVVFVKIKKQLNNVKIEKEKYDITPNL